MWYNPALFAGPCRHSTWDNPALLAGVCGILLHSIQALVVAIVCGITQVYRQGSPGYYYIVSRLYLSPYIGCLKSNDTLTIYLAEALSCFQFVLSTFLSFHHETGSIVYWFWNAQPCTLHKLIVALSESIASIFFQTWCLRITSQEKQRVE